MPAVFGFHEVFSRARDGRRDLLRRDRTFANAGEVAVSRTVADLLGATEYALQDRGEHELKGIAGRWALFTISN